MLSRCVCLHPTPRFSGQNAPCMQFAPTKPSTVCLCSWSGPRTSAWKGRRCWTGESESRVAAGRRGKALLCATKRRQRRRPQAAQWQLRARGSAAPYVRGGGGTDEGPRWRQSGRTWSGRGTLRLYAAQLCLVVRIKRGAACVRKRQDRHSQRECKK